MALSRSFSFCGVTVRPRARGFIRAGTVLSPAGTVNILEGKM